MISEILPLCLYSNDPVQKNKSKNKNEEGLKLIGHLSEIYGDSVDSNPTVFCMPNAYHQVLFSRDGNWE